VFTFPEIGSLSDDEALEALETPALDEGVGWEPGALDQVLDITRGYPYFLQEFGKAAWDVADGPDRITADEARRSLPIGIAELDDGFFRVRAGRTSDLERAYLRAMAELGSGPVRSAEVAAILGRPMSGLATTRDSLVKRALCYSPRRGEIEFTVPMFDEFMKRWIPLSPGGE